MRRFMTEILPDTNRELKLLISFKATIFREGKRTPYCKTFMSLSPFSSQKEIKDYIKRCEEKRLDPDDQEIWGAGYFSVGWGFSEELYNDT